MSRQIVSEMQWTEVELAQLPTENNFRMRGLETTRMDTLIDAAFAFVLSMLVISQGAIPASYKELIVGIKTIPALAMSFFVLMLFWLSHREWSRRYGIETRSSILISVSLVFALLIYVYPLRIIFEAMFHELSNGYFPLNYNSKTEEEVRGFFAFYAYGYLVMSLLVAALQYIALKRSKLIGLNQFEYWDTQASFIVWSISAIISIASLAITYIVPVQKLGLAGYIFFSVFIVLLVRKRMRANRLRV